MTRTGLLLCSLQRTQGAWSMRSPEAFAALIAAVASLIVSFVTAIVGYFAKRNSDRDLAQLNNSLSESRAERDAQRDYEYEARKRLYSEFQPLLFQLVELSESAYARITNIAFVAKQGYLDGRQGWLNYNSGYFLTSTIYRLMAPLVVFRLSQRRLTLVDLSVDSQIRAQYTLAKLLYSSFHDGFDLAAEGPAVPYNPNRARASLRPFQLPLPVSVRQHARHGHLDQLCEAMTIRESSDLYRCMSYGEFLEEYENKRSRLRRNSQEMVEIVHGFHPMTRPVLWRILLVQAPSQSGLAKRRGRIHSMQELEGQS